MLCLEPARDRLDEMHLDGGISTRANVSIVSEWVSPIGTSVEDDIAESVRTDPEYRAEHERLAPFEAIARIVIMRRGELGISQAELARRASTTASAISRMERGQHRTRPETLKKVAEALGGQAVVGFAFGGEPQLVTL